MFDSKDRPGHLARWIADATRDTEGHEIEKCPHPCSYCADRVAVEQFEQMVKALKAVSRLAGTAHRRVEMMRIVKAALKAAQGE